MRLAAVLIAGLLACTGAANPGKPDKRPAPEDTRAGSAREPMTNMTSDMGGSFLRGSAVTPADQLVAWLDQQVRGGEPLRVRLPVVLANDGFGFSTMGARIGGSADAVTIFVNDAALGIGLAQQARKQCQDEPTCAMWLEGYWRGKQDGEYTFEVTRIHGRIAADALAAATHAEVEGGGN
jgi:hypothetical protein